MAWTDVAPWLVGQATKISFFNKLLGNTKWHRDSSGDFTKVPIGAGQGTTPGSPGYHWADSPTTGVYKPANDQLGVSVAGVSKINISATLIDIQTALKAISLQLTNPLSIANGGTGGSSLVTAQRALGLDPMFWYSPSVLGLNNLAAATPMQCMLLRVGDHTFVSGKFTADGAAGSTGLTAVLDMTLPYTEPIMHDSGVGVLTMVDQYGVEATGAVFRIGNNMRCQWKLPDTNLHTYAFNFYYYVTLPV